MAIARLVVAGALVASLSVATLTAGAQPAGTIHRIGLLAGSSAAGAESVRGAVVGGLADLGYREHHNLALVERYADGRFERLPALRLRADRMIE